MPKPDVWSFTIESLRLFLTIDRRSFISLFLPKPTLKHLIIYISQHTMNIINIESFRLYSPYKLFMCESGVARFLVSALTVWRFHHVFISFSDCQACVIFRLNLKKKNWWDWVTTMNIQLSYKILRDNSYS